MLPGPWQERDSQLYERGTRSWEGFRSYLGKISLNSERERDSRLGALPPPSRELDLQAGYSFHSGVSQNAVAPSPLAGLSG